MNSFSSCTTALYVVCTNIGLHNDVQHQCTSGGGKSEECLSSPRCSGLQRRVCNWHWHGLGPPARQRAATLPCRFRLSMRQAWSFADPRPFRGQLQTNAHTSIVEAIYSPKVMLFSAKLSGLDRKPRVHVTRPCGTALLSEGNAKKDRRFHWGAIKSRRTRCYRRTESAHRFSLCWQINGAETSRNPSSRYGRL